MKRKLGNGGDRRIILPHPLKVEPPPDSRQVLRARLRRKYYGQVRIAGDRHRFPKNAQPLPRRDRRALARAYAARDFAEVRSGTKQN